MEEEGILTLVLHKYLGVPTCMMSWRLSVKDSSASTM